METWWQSFSWRSYETICGGEPRALVLSNSSWYTRVIDLRQDWGALWHDVRKSYKSPIRRAEEKYELKVATRDKVEAVMGEFRVLHTKLAGRQTRPDDSWTLMTIWAREGQHEVWYAKDRSADQNVGFIYIYRLGYWAYYGHSACGVRDLNAALVWNAIRRCKFLDMHVFEVGWQGEAQTDKGRDIEFFRRGFGGFDIPAVEAPRFCERQYVGELERLRKS